MLSVIQTLDVVIITKCTLVSAKIAENSFETYLLSMLGCLQFIVDPKTITLLQFSIQTKVKKFGDISGKGLINKKSVIKCCSHLNLSLGCGIDANNNDAIVFF